MTLPHITVCVCTFRRPELLARLLAALDVQDTGNSFTYSIVVADNDASLSAEAMVNQFATESGKEVRYCAEPRQNIALARNRALANARGDFIAFVDDDEFPVRDWLRHLLTTCEKYQVAGVLGPVRPHFDEPPPQWVVMGRFCERPEHVTGTWMPWNKCRTGNVLFRRAILNGVSVPFDPVFGVGGEDVDFFRRMCDQGHGFIWCNEAAVYEVVPPTRCKRSYMLKRALLRGRTNLKFRNTLVRSLVTSAVALPAYTFVLPCTLLLGQHVFMKYCIRTCDHLGRVLALLGLNPVDSRPS